MTQYDKLFSQIRTGTINIHDIPNDWSHKKHYYILSNIHWRAPELSQPNLLINLISNEIIYFALNFQGIYGFIYKSENTRLQYHKNLLFHIPSRYDLMMGINARGTFLTYVHTFDKCYTTQNIIYCLANVLV